MIIYKKNGEIGVNIFFKGPSDIRSSVPGEPGVDYPAYERLPQTRFTCEGRDRGKSIITVTFSTHFSLPGQCYPIHYRNNRLVILLTRNPLHKIKCKKQKIIKNKTRLLL